MEDPELKKLAQSLPRTILAGRADSTTKKYLYAFGRWKEWAENKREVDVFPVQDIEFSLYLQHIAETTESKATVDGAVNAVSWAHHLMAGLQPITSFPFVHSVQAGLQRQLAKPKVKKEPVSVEMLTALVQSLDGSLLDLRLVTMALLAFAAFPTM